MEWKAVTGVWLRKRKKKRRGGGEPILLSKNCKDLTLTTDGGQKDYS